MSQEELPLLKRDMLPQPESLLRTARRYLVGVGLLLGVVLLWTVSNFITNSLETGEKAWNKPFLITYIDTAGFTVYLIPTILRYWRGELGQSRKHDESYQPISQTEDPIPITRRSHSRSPSASPMRAPLALSIDLDRTPLAEAQTEEPLPKLTIRETARVAAWWAAVWFAANWAVNASLAWTSVASVTILSSTSGFFTLALGRMVGVETLTQTKFLAVVASFIGVIMVTRSDSTLSSSALPSDLPAHPVLGDLAAILSACFYAVYVILLKKQVGDEDRADMQLMLGFAGLFSTTLLLPVIPILHYLNWETFELPPTRTAWLICGINMAITLSSDYMYMLAMLKTTPMLATLGLSLTIPLALGGSLFIPSSSPGAITALSLGGAVLVVSAFGLLGMQGWRENVEPEGEGRRVERGTLEEGAV